MKVLKAYKFRLYPSAEQKAFFIFTFGCVRFTYNHLLKERQQEYQRTGFLGKGRTPAQLKKEFPFLKKTDSLALANAQLNLDRAYRNYFRSQAGFPKLKTKKSLWQSYTTNNQQGTIDLVEGQLKLPKLKEHIPVLVHRAVKGKIKSATISAKYNEIFYVSLLCEEEVAPLPKTQKQVAVVFCQEIGIRTSQKILYPPYAVEGLESSLVKAERRLQIKATSARKRKVKLMDARNYQKQKRRVAQLYQIRYQRKRDYLEKLSFGLVQAFDVIFIGKDSIQEQPGPFDQQDWLLFLQKLAYKAKWYQKQLVFVEVPRLLQDPSELERTGTALLNKLNWQGRQGSPRE